jgi:pimeloyl-ACP methyl ester carboxylesterase
LCNDLLSFTRRSFLLLSVALGATAVLKTPASGVAQENTAIRPFSVNVDEAEIVELRRRIAATRWPDRETVSDTSQGVPLGMIQGLAEYWGAQYDWRRFEARLNTFPQFMTEIDGVGIHFIHVRSKHDNAMPLIMTHGWPGSLVEFMRVIEPLTDPTAYGVSANDAFHLVCPQMPGYGFSAKPITTGWDPRRIASAWVELMSRLGYTQFVAQGGDWGAAVSDSMALQSPPGLLGIHVNLPATVPSDIARALQCGDPPPGGLAADERAAYDQLTQLYAKKRAYALMMGTRPQTLYGLADSPVGLAAWLLDHGDGYSQPAAALVSAVQGRTINGHSAGAITKDDVLDDVTLYWLTNTGISSGRLYWETHFSLYNAANVSMPAAVSVFPGENYQAPRSWAERAYQKLIYYNRVAEGGHFAAWEQPELFSEEIRAGFRPLRKAGATS